MIRHLLICHLILRLATLAVARCDDLKGVHLVLVVVQNPPYETVINNGNGNITLIGVTRNMNDWLSRKLNYTYSFVLAPEDDVKKYGWTLASLLQVNRGLANLTVSAAAITLDRRELADEITFPIFEESIRLLAPRPSEEDRLFAFIRPFDFWLWTLLATSIVIIVVMMSCLTWYNEKFSDAPRRESFSSLLGSYGMYAIDVLTNHGNYVRRTYVNSLTLLVAFWLLGISVLIFSYSSIVVSSLTAPRLKPSINSYEDLAASKEVTLIIRTDLVPTKRVLDGETPIYRQIVEKAKKHHPESITNDIVRTDELLETGRYAFTWMETYVRFFVATHYKKEKKCRFEMSNTYGGSSYYYHQFMKKGLKYRDAFQFGWMQLWETGLSRFWAKSLLPRADECFARNTGKVKEAKIKLSDLTSAFFIFGVGMSASLGYFVLELSFFYCLNQRTRRNRNT